MENTVYLASMEEALLWIVVGAITIVAQIFKASRKSSPRPPSTTTGPSQPGVSPEDEIRKFLESLGAVPPASAPGSELEQEPAAPSREPVRMPPPVPRKKLEIAVSSARPQKTTTVTTHVQEFVVPVRREGPPAEPRYIPASKEEVEAQLAKKTTNLNPYFKKSDLQKDAQTRLQNSVIHALRQAETLRSAVILREILGPPVAMQNAKR